MRLAGARKKIRIGDLLVEAGAITEEQLKADEERYPMKRYGKPEDIAFMIIYLLSEASSWVTGQNFIIDGGKSLV